MHTLETLKKEFQKLSTDDLVKFREWLAEFDGGKWNRTIEDDFKTGTLDSPVREPHVPFEKNSYQKKSMTYRIALHQSEEGFSVSAPELPGCWSQGTTEEEAIENIKSAIQEYLEVVMEQLKGENFRFLEVTV